MGGRPPAGQWVRLEVPASYVGMEGKKVHGMSFGVFRHGEHPRPKIDWDYSGKSSRAMLTPPPLTGTRSLFEVYDPDRNQQAYRYSSSNVLYGNREYLTGTHYEVLPNQAPGTQPVHQFRTTSNPVQRLFHTMNKQEGVDRGYEYSGIAFYAYPPAGSLPPRATPLYRYRQGSKYLYSSAANDSRQQSLGYTKDGIVGYIFSKDIYNEIAPNAPVYLRLDGQYLTWRDMAVNETGFKIEYLPVDSDVWQQIGEAPANTTSYKVGGSSSVDCSLPQVLYRVRAFNSVGYSESPVTQRCSVYPYDVSANTVPTVSIRNPLDGAVVSGNIVVEANAFDVDGNGSIAKVEFFNSNNKIGESTFAPYTFVWSNVAPGNYTLTAKVTDSEGAMGVSTPVNIRVTESHAAQPARLPGTILAGNYDRGGEGVAYHDADAGNNCNSYRTPTGVDACSPTVVGWTAAGEWIDYTVDVATTGMYTLEATTGTVLDNQRFHVEVDGANRTGSITAPNTGNYGVGRVTRKTGIELTAGRHVVRMFFETGGINFFSLHFTDGSATYDAVTEFVPMLNPSGAWSYGYQAGLNSAFTPLPATGDPHGMGAGMSTWYLPNPYNLPGILHNGTGATHNLNNIIYQPTDVLNVHPGPAGERGAVRWTAPAAATVTIEGRFEGLDITGTPRDVAITHNTITTLFAVDFGGYGARQSFSLTRTVAAGDTIEFSVGRGSDNNLEGDSTGLAVTITQYPN